MSSVGSNGEDQENVAGNEQGTSRLAVHPNYPKICRCFRADGFRWPKARRRVDGGRNFARGDFRRATSERAIKYRIRISPVHSLCIRNLLFIPVPCGSLDNFLRASNFDKKYEPRLIYTSRTVWLCQFALPASLSRCSRTSSRAATSMAHRCHEYPPSVPLPRPACVPPEDSNARSRCTNRCPLRGHARRSIRGQPSLAQASPLAGHLG